MFNGKINISSIISDVYNNPDKYGIVITETEVSTCKIDNNSNYKNLAVFIDENIY